MAQVTKTRHPWPPVADAQTEVLILGTMPSPASLADGFYYGHPRNAFWPIMERLFGIQRTLPPKQRAERLLRHGIGIWDVLKECERPGALDADIRREVANDFGALLVAHPRIRVIAFNDQKAAALFLKHVNPSLPRQMEYLRLPSTSPAHAQPLAAKEATWRDRLAGVGLTPRDVREDDFSDPAEYPPEPSDEEINAFADSIGLNDQEP